MHPHESSLENHTANFPSDTGSDEQSSEGSQTDSALDSDHLRLLQMIARSSGIDLRSVGLFDSLDTQDSDDESNSDSSSHIDNTSSEDLGNTTLDRSRDLDREQSTSIPDSLGSTSESSGVSDGESKSDWRLVMMLKVGSSKRVVDASESIFGVLHKMYQSDPSLREADFWSTTYELEFYVEFGDGPQPTDDQQCTQRLGHAENKDRVSAMDGRDQDPSDNFGELGDESVGDLSRREARRNRRVYSEAQIPLGRIQRQKVRISRTRMLESAFKVLEMYGSAKTVLEIEYFDEAGIGNGPTLEFYSLVSRCLQERALGIWRDGSQGSETATTEPVQYVDAPLGLFPRACGATKAPKQSNKQMRDSHYEAASPSDRFVNMFQFIGHFVAKGLVDNRILDLPLHEEFWAAVHRHSKATVAKANGSSACWTWGQLESLDPQFADSLWYLQQFVDAKNKIYARKDFTMEQQQRKVSGIRDSKTQARVEDLALDFTLPGNPTIELRPGGADIPVTINNVHTYIDLVAQWTLYTGVCTQVAAFCEGFNRIFPVSNLSIFTPAELCKIFGPSKSSEDWTATTISSTIELGDGYSLTSPPVKMMIDLLESFSVAERREFLLFSTGSPRLPIGGFQALSPPLKLVLKNSESPLIPDDYLPSVMTCSNLIKLPAYSSFEILKKRWNQAVSEGCHSFHLS
ncbi:Ubiquitin fusion degradation protein 4 [Coemansia sp. RSA 1804]|nr:Ubiquitin fusion degradation protein 4 [Coemansia sp. RSA 1804]